MEDDRFQLSDLLVVLSRYKLEVNATFSLIFAFIGMKLNMCGHSIASIFIQEHNPDLKGVPNAVFG
jgi:hypothetical protein